MDGDTIIERFNLKGSNPSFTGFGHYSGTLSLDDSFNIKCKYPIAIPDCFSISLAIVQDCPVFFLQEKELSGELIEKIKMEFNADIYGVET